MSAPSGRIEVITRGERRRHWTVEQKRDIALESLAPGGIAAAIARKYEIGTGLLYTWRKQLLSGELGQVPEALPRFLQVDLAPPATGSVGPLESPSGSVRTEGNLAGLRTLPQEASCSEGIIEIILTSGVRVRVGAGSDETTLRRVLVLLAGRWWLTPLYELVVATVLGSPKIFADDTGLPVLDPGRGRTKTGYLWCYAVDDRPWCGPTHPAVAYIYAEDRRNARPAAHLAHFDGVLQVDGYSGFKRLAGDRADQSIRLAFCWAELPKVSARAAGGMAAEGHMRREFFQFHASTKSPLAAEVLARIAALYAIEAEIRGSPPSTGNGCGRSEVDRSWKPCMIGCRFTSAGCPAPPIWPRPCATRSATGRAGRIPR